MGQWAGGVGLSANWVPQVTQMYFVTVLSPMRLDSCIAAVRAAFVRAAAMHVAPVTRVLLL
jgi:hypothetical protein